MGTGWAVPFIVLGGMLQTAGGAMNAQLLRSLVNPWLASAVSFAIITFFFTGLFIVLPHPLPTAKALAEMPWWAPVGGLVGAVQVFAGLTLIGKVGAGTFVGLTVCAALLASLAVDHFGLLRVDVHPITTMRLVGGALMVLGVYFIVRN